MSQKIVLDLLRELGKKKGDVNYVRPQTSVQEAAILMGQPNVGALAVATVESGSTLSLIGIVSERDIVRKVVAFGKDPRTTLVSEIMTTDLVSVTPLTNLEECEQKMKEKGIRHLPVIQNGELLAMISIRDLLVSTRAEEQNLRHYLESYITGPH